MIGNQFTEMDLAILFDVERTVILSQSFIEPERDIAGTIVDQQVNILVIDHAERILRRFRR